MEFQGPPPGTNGKGEARPYSARSNRPRPPASPPPPRTSSATSRSRPRPSARRDLVTVAMHWFGWLIPLSFVTQLWAGSQFSPGQGGGLVELVSWVCLFGAAMLAMVAERHAHAPHQEIGEDALLGAFGGWLVGFVVAIAWFSSMNGPSTGTWFVAPAAATTGAALMLYGIRPLRR